MKSRTLLRQITDAARSTDSQHTLIILAALFERFQSALTESSTRIGSDLAERKTELAAALEQGTVTRLGAAIEMALRKTHPAVSGASVAALVKAMLSAGSLLHDGMRMRACLEKGIGIFLHDLCSSATALATHGAVICPNWKEEDTVVLRRGVFLSYCRVRHF